MSKVKELSKDDFNEEVINSDMPVLVDFWAPWCQPCVMMSPVLDDLSEELSDKVKIVKLNVNEAENQELAERYDIQGIPNMKLFKNGEVVKEIVGMQTKGDLKGQLEKEIGSE